MLELALLLLGITGLSVLLGFIWLPLALLPMSVALIAAALPDIWERLHGKSSSTPRNPG